jgi:hypothetical protein
VEAFFISTLSIRNDHKEKKGKKKAYLIGGRGKQSKEERNKWHVWRQWVYAVVPCFAYWAGL